MNERYFQVQASRHPLGNWVVRGPQELPHRYRSPISSKRRREALEMFRQWVKTSLRLSAFQWISQEDSFDLPLVPQEDSFDLPLVPPWSR